MSLRAIIVSFLSAVVLILPSLSLQGCGQAKELSRGDYIGSSTGGDSPGTIYTVKLVIPPSTTGSIPGWNYPGNSPVNNAANDYPFSENPIDFNDANFLNTQTPFQFTYNYPPNNFKISDAHIVIDTQRDGSDTEGIFVDGVFTGRPPLGLTNESSPKTLHSHYVDNASANTVNNYFMDFSLAHYKQNTINTFDLTISKLLTPSPLNVLDVLEDGELNVVVGDDSPVYQANLVINGYTISNEELSCTTSNIFTFENHYLHNDGNTIGQAAFIGTIESPFDSWSSGAADAVEYYFDVQLPLVDNENINVSTATITMNVQRTTDASAVVVNGVGVGESGFDTGTATSSVERWETGAGYVSYWESVLAGVPTNGTPTAVTLDLRQLVGPAVIRDLLAQGNFNVAVAGGINRVEASGDSSTRAFGNPVSGPELNLLGTYFTEVCSVPNNADSPLEDGPIEPTDPGDVDPPEIISLSASEVTSTSAVIQWLTAEGADTQVDYGIGSLSNSSTLDSTPAVFHRVELTGLQPYKFYLFRAKSADGNANQTTSNTLVFRTLR
ncbi:MAG: fibronectin type III domain-containing protein [Bdellovibrionales bacterium]|nr:fibronectin type III domain-containing protein [Bdellovibrionales bacterium]